MVEKSHLCFEGTIAGTEDSRDTVRLFLYIPFFAGNIVVRIGLRDGVLILALAEAAEDALKAIHFLLDKVVSPFQLALTHVGGSSQLGATGLV